MGRPQGAGRRWPHECSVSRPRGGTHRCQSDPRRRRRDDAVRRAARARRCVVRPDGGPDHRPDRAERGRQDHVVQLPDRPVRTDVRLGVAARRAAAPGPGAGDREGHRADLPEHPAVPLDDRRGERPGRAARPDEAEPAVVAAARAEVQAQRGRGARAQRGAAQLRRARAVLRRAGAQPALRRPAAPGDRPRPGDGPVGAAARRADRRDERAGDRGHPAADLRDPGPGGLGGRHRARHQVHLHPLRPGARAGAGGAAGGGEPGRGARRPPRGRGLPRGPAGGGRGAAALVRHGRRSRPGARTGKRTDP